MFKYIPLVVSLLIAGVGGASVASHHYFSIANTPAPNVPQAVQIHYQANDNRQVSDYDANFISAGGGVDTIQLNLQTH